MKTDDDILQAYRKEQAGVYNGHHWPLWVMSICLGVFNLCLLAPLHAEQLDAQPSIGEVTLVIGQAQAINNNGQKRTLKRADPVYAGEILQTGEGGHVHLNFIDDATLSLRPKSRLVIETYHYDKQEPKNSAIRFSLEVGVVRSISGKATQAAHDRFRLNTPITAIGVLGTDFVVRAESDKTWAGVYSGAIAISPLSAQCQANALGACAGATRLSETMGSVMIELSGRRAKEKIVPFDPDILSKKAPPDAQDKPANAVASAPERITVSEIKAVDVSENLNKPQPPEIPQEKPEVPPPPVEVEVPRESSPFAWARWGSQWAGDTMSQPYAQAREGRGVVVGNTHYALFRAPTEITELEPRAGVYDFNLVQGQAYFIGNGVSWASQGPMPANIDEASLQMDFAQRQFNTRLQISHSLAGTANLNLSGAIQNNGVFLAQQPGSQVSGALSLDGGYASMLFEQSVRQGVFTGITDWARK